ncbi:MAG TPA: formyltransferase family protein [Longimicrobium sp.]|jgi:folate-dependent phosphoribosylglycinamide formyltransferase PurN|uniref:formyltransferase family protein n=1 Tax=Longimicrobium sp. TaxID=2029185 RepID=UPI002EDB498B
MARVVLITNDSMHGRRVLQALWERGIVLDAALYLTGGYGLPAPRGVGFMGRIAQWPRAVARTARRRLRFVRERRAAYASRCARVVGTGAMNSPRLLRDLRALSPDWIVLGGGGILRDEVIAAARLGVLNAHPALLPWIRGTGVTGHALEHGVALGATLHRVDRGIDTGAILQRRLIPVGTEGATLDALELNCLQLAAEMMADAVQAIVGGGELPAGTPQSARYPLFTFPTDHEARRHRALPADVRARALFDAWRPLCADPERLILPADLATPATVTLPPAKER